VAGWAAGCNFSQAFACQSDDACRQGGLSGVCQSETGFCSFPDSMCASGQRYGAHAGRSLAGMCTNPDGADGGTDTGAGTMGSADGSSGVGTSEGGPGTAGSDAVTSAGSSGAVSDTSTTTSGSSASEGTSSASDASSDGTEDVPPGTEVCDGIDNDGDGLVDEYSPFNETCDGCNLIEWDVETYWICPGPTDWVAAHTQCEQRGADLASIHDDQENAQVGAALAGVATAAWLAARAESIDVWGWSDGRAWDYDAFGQMQPNYNDPLPVCLTIELNDAEWNDQGCDEDYAYVCEADLMGP
jgi:hypothetical protein